MYTLPFCCHQGHRGGQMIKNIYNKRHLLKKLKPNKIKQGCITITIKIKAKTYVYIHPKQLKHRAGRLDH